MTIAEAKHALITTAKNEIGYHEGDNNYNKYSIGMAKYYGWDVQNQPYCDIFTDWTFIRTFGGDAAAKMTYQPMGSFSALCRQSAQYFKNNNAWFASPEIGDVIFFYYDGAINHQGIVVEVSGGLVYTVEGNCGNEVRLAAYDMKDTYVVGYASPRYEERANVAIDYLLHEYTQGNYIIAAVDLPVRKSPSYSSAVTFTLHRGDLMHIYECKGGWGRTDYGWIPMTDTQPIDVR